MDNPQKNIKKLYYSIGEVSKITELKQNVTKTSPKHRSSSLIIITTHHRDLIVHLGQARQDLGEVDAWDPRLDRFKLATHIIRHVLLWIPQVEMARPTLQVAEDDAFGLAPSGAAASIDFLGLRLQLEHTAE